VAANVRDGRLHDARHTAATVLLILGVPDAVVDAIMGWEPGKSARMRRRYRTSPAASSRTPPTRSAVSSGPLRQAPDREG
jgi:integrase